MERDVRDNRKYRIEEEIEQRETKNRRAQQYGRQRVLNNRKCVNKETTSRSS